MKILVRVFLLIVIFISLFLWFYFPRIALDKNSIVFSSNDLTKELSYRFVDPFSFVRDLILETPKIVRIVGQGQPVEQFEAIVPSFSSTKVNFKLPSDFLCVPLNGAYMIEHTAKGGMEEIRTELECKIEECPESFDVKTAVESISLFSGVTGGTSAYSIPIEMNYECSIEELKEVLTIKSADSVDVDFAMGADREFSITVSLNGKKPSTPSFPLHLSLKHDAPAVTVQVNQYVAPESDILFDFDSPEVAGNNTQIKEHQAFVELINQGSSISVQIVGHADYRGTEEHNLRLSSERAMRVSGLLGLDDIQVQAAGESQPIIGKQDRCMQGIRSDCESIRVARDRRVEVVYSVN